MAGEVHIFGIRHHGPGCARSLCAALSELAPDCVLIEGPADAEAVLPLAIDPAMAPPVALLVYPEGAPERAAYYPFADFSPEWQAMRYGLLQGITVRFMDLPLGHRFAAEDRARAESAAALEGESRAVAGDSSGESKGDRQDGSKPVAVEQEGAPKEASKPVAVEQEGAPKDASKPAAVEQKSKLQGDRQDASPPVAVEQEGAPKDASKPVAVEQEGASSADQGDESQVSKEHERRARELQERDADLRIDPLGVLAEAAGYSDRELWWEHQVEQRQDPSGLFEGILEAMSALREGLPSPTGHEGRREAYMRRTIRSARRTHRRVAVICGAWHAPALRDLRGAKADNARLKGMPKTKVIATWIPWTYNRLTFESGYGAGVRSPGWYQHLWQSPERSAVRWAVRAARLLRAQDLDASSAGVIEVVRLAESLAAVRELPLPGLAELREAIGAVLCHGEPAPLALIARDLEVGSALGEVPEGAPMVPLQRDLQLRQRRLRMKPSAEIRDLKLDLRKETGLGRSTLLHRLLLLEIDWGELCEASGQGGVGSFREHWRIQWRPELAVKVIEANLLGNSVESAALERVRRRAATANLSELTALALRILPASLGAAMEPLIARLQAVSAVTADVRELMRALPALVRIGRYGDVRGAREASFAALLDSLVARILVGLGPACEGLDEEAAADMVVGIGEVHEGLRLLDRVDLRQAWMRALRALMERRAHARIQGRAARLRLEFGDLDEQALGLAASVALSRAQDPSDAAAWAEGLLRGSGLVLVHQNAIWRVLDGWLSHLSVDAFDAILPMLRRAFSEFTDPERRLMAATVRALDSGGEAALQANHPGEEALDLRRADRVLPVLASILGVSPPESSEHQEGQA